MLIEVWCCPTEGCPDFFGAASAGDLSQKFSHPKVEHRFAHKQEHGVEHRHSRAQCPLCRTRKIEVERVLVRMWVSVPVPEAQAA